VHVVALLCVCPADALHAETVHAVFDCEAGKSIQAAFDNGPKPGVRLSLSDGRRWMLPQAPSASGARYANGDESIVFWNKGNTAFIEEGGRTTYQGCVAKK
jgi:membrane-bound inhibitor of C-type lysozyme